MHYFDNNATTPLAPEARAAWLEAQEQAWQNPSSPYAASANVHNRLESARQELAEMLDVKPAGVIFTSGATEANNAVLAHMSLTLPSARVMVSAVEHPSVIDAAKYYFEDQLDILPVDSQGRVDLDHLKEQLTKGRAGLVSVMAANNETGTLQPWQEVIELCRAAGVAVHIDASQWLGKMPLASFASADFVTGCGHKFCGPKGVGFLSVSEKHYGIRLQTGGEQEDGRRAGTEDFPGIAAMLAALRTRQATIVETRDRWLEGRECFEAALRTAIPDVIIISDNAPRLENTVMFIAPVHRNTRWVTQLDKRSFCTSTGSACSSGKESASHVLAAMGYTNREALRAIRISAGWDTTVDDWRELAAAIADIWHELQSEASVSATVIDV